MTALILLPMLGMAQNYGTYNPYQGINSGITIVTPDYSGGYNVFNPNGGSASIRPDYSGGYNVYDSGSGSFQSVRPDYNGGFIIYGY